MLTITDNARDRLTRKLVLKNAKEGVALRLSRTEGGWQFRPDTARPNDVVFAHEGKNVLLLDEAALVAVKSMTLDVRDTDAGPRLRMLKSSVHGG